MKFTSSIFGILLVAAGAQAGIYNTTETDDIRLSTDISQFRDTLVKVRSIGFDKVDFDNILRKRYLLNEALGGTTPAGLTLEQKLDYSAVLLRRKKFQQAIDFLAPIARQHPEIFLFDCHLAMAYWLSGQQGNDRRAIEILSQALSKKSWPENFHDLTEEQRNFLLTSMGWNEGPYDFYRTAELHLLKLMKQRLAEPAGTPFETVDAIFDGGKGAAIKFVNDDGKFEPGRVASNQVAKLPPRALEIVEQLLLWLPEDLRLYWLLGEIANSQWTPEDLKRDAKNSKDALKREQAFNNLKAANTIYKELIDDFQVRAKDLRERRQIMRDYVQTVEAPQVTFDAIEKTLDDADKKATPGVPMTTRTMAITFAAGMAVGIFAVWQFQEIRRRRRGG